jgi:hypothetical protein
MLAPTYGERKAMYPNNTLKKSDNEVISVKGYSQLNLIIQPEFLDSTRLQIICTEDGARNIRISICQSNMCKEIVMDGLFDTFPMEFPKPIDKSIDKVFKYLDINLDGFIKKDTSILIDGTVEADDLMHASLNRTKEYDIVFSPSILGMAHSLIFNDFSSIINRAYCWNFLRSSYSYFVQNTIEFNPTTLFQL